LILSELDIGADGKLMKKIQEKIKAKDPSISSAIISSDDDGEK
jgi:hypothetical protein